MFLRLRCVDLEIALESMRISDAYSDTYFGHVADMFRILAEENGFFFAEKSKSLSSI